MELPVHQEVNTKGIDFAFYQAGDSSCVVLKTVELLVHLAVITKRMGSAKAIKDKNP